MAPQILPKFVEPYLDKTFLGGRKTSSRKSLKNRIITFIIFSSGKFGLFAVQVFF